jgi:osmotically-inducible protein OsmY
MFKSSALFLFAALISSAMLSPANAQDVNSAVAPDNTSVNMRDRSASEPTADQGGEALTDRQIMQAIRKEIISDKSLSTYAHNVKIISENGQVTLKGPVRSEHEKERLEAKAISVAGEDNVTNELSIKHAN